MIAPFFLLFMFLFRLILSMDLFLLLPLLVLSPNFVLFIQFEFIKSWALVDIPLIQQADLFVGLPNIKKS